MKAMILAAGKGTRLRPITYKLPKPMVPIFHRPVMDYLVELLKHHHFDEIMVNVSHLAREIENYFRDGQKHGVNMAYSFEGSLDSQGNLVGKALGSAGGIRKIQDFSGFFDETFVVLCGDAIVDVDLTTALQWHRERGAIATILTKPVDPSDVSSYGVVVTDDQSQVKSFQEKPRPEAALSYTVNTGIYIFEPEIIDYIPPHQIFDIGTDLFPKLLDLGVPFNGLSMDFQWIDIGQLSDYRKAISQILDGKIPGVPIPWPRSQTWRLYGFKRFR